MIGRARKVAPDMNHCIVVLSDMLFATRVSHTTEQLGGSCQVARDANHLSEILADGAVNTVLVDMSCEALDPERAIRETKELHPAVRVVAFYPHVQTELADNAKSAGADDAWPRSAVVRRLASLLYGDA